MVPCFIDIILKDFVLKNVGINQYFVSHFQVKQKLFGGNKNLIYFMIWKNKTESNIFVLSILRFTLVDTILVTEYLWDSLVVWNFSRKCL